MKNPELGNREGRQSARTHPLKLQASRQVFKDDVNGFSSTLDIFFMELTL
jgi:hypothetical protein